MRPLYERPEDIANERRLAELVASEWDVQPLKLKTAYSVDYALTRAGRTLAFSEFKCRTYSMPQMDRMGGFMLSLHKWAAIKTLTDASGLPFVVVVGDGEGEVWHHRPTDFSHDGVAFGGRMDRGDHQDVEPVILLRMARFTRLNSRLGKTHSPAA